MPYGEIIDQLLRSSLFAAGVLVGALLGGFGVGMLEFRRTGDRSRIFLIPLVSVTSFGLLHLMLLFVRPTHIM